MSASPIIWNGMQEHRSRLVERFTKRYNLHKLVYFEQSSSIEAAIMREKQIKGWSRAKKNGLVERMNPEWIDLGSDAEGDPSAALGMTMGGRV
jgi:predicted GIY-YIG superfamily endonuclease